MNIFKPEKAIVLGAVWKKSSNYFKQQTCKKVTVFSVLSGQFKLKFHTGATHFFCVEDQDKCFSVSYLIKA